MGSSLRVAVTLEQCWHDVPGGVARSALDTVAALLAHTDLDLVGVAARHHGPPPAPWVPPIPVAQLPLPRLALYESWHRLRRPRVERATGSVDVVHVTGMAMPPPSAPLVVTVHDLAFLDDPTLFTRRGVSFFTRAIDLARRDATLVTCPSQATLDDCLAHGFDADRLRLVPWGVRPAAVDDADLARVRAAHRLERPFVLWTGTIEPRKNVPVLLDAFGRLDRDDVELVLAGPEGWNEDLAALEARARGRVRRLGFVPAGDLPALYAAATVFAYPSRKEGFGLPVLEALAQGTPVVTSAGTATAEVLGPDGVAGRAVPVGDAAALAAALAGYLDDPAARAAAGAAARARAGGYGWARTAASFEAVYREAVARAGGRSTR